MDKGGLEPPTFRMRSEHATTASLAQSKLDAYASSGFTAAYKDLYTWGTIKAVPTVAAPVQLWATLLLSMPGLFFAAGTLASTAC